MRITCAIFLWLAGGAVQAVAQASGNLPKSAAEKLQQQVKTRITVNGKADSAIDRRSEQAFMPWKDKVIRKIDIKHISFERNFYDTTRQVRMRSVARLANRLHVTTREQMIRDNLFIRSGRPLDPYKLADNERYLRDLDFLLDATIAVVPLEHTSDSVDLVIFTRDVFSLGGNFSPRSVDRYRFGVYDVNVGGYAQRLGFNALYDAARHPQMGYQVLYSKYSVAGSLINATLSFTQLNNGSSLGMEDEYAVYLRLDRPLVSPYTRMAGGVEISRNWSVNVYDKSPADFRQYSYNITDVWAGYNLGIRNRQENRGRHFIGFRIFDQHFNQRPAQPAEVNNPVYNHQRYWLGGVTFFKQNFYKTRYIYGFGRTEDVPYGRQLILVAGKVSQLQRSRPYAGAEFTFSGVRKNGDFLTATLSAGGFVRNRSAEDLVVAAQLTFFSRILEWHHSKVRQSVTLSYSTLYNQQTLAPLSLRSELGLNSFPADSLLGNRRLGVQAETLLFTPASLLGFRLAPLVFAGAGLIAGPGQKLLEQPAWLSLGAGMRTRNENLVFGTIDLRFFYFPRTTEGIDHFRVTLTSNLQVKYTAGFVKKPQLVRYN